MSKRWLRFIAQVKILDYDHLRCWLHGLCHRLLEAPLVKLYFLFFKLILRQVVVTSFGCDVQAACLERHVVNSYSNSSFPGKRRTTLALKQAAVSAVTLSV